ncbi:NADPH:quinone oxidoreductase family protein [Ancylobacter sp. MQZ15Z-1]|uniref:NADPH:quinone oxidoreductase family protein n=1 Tax=Ancylobacter mangrovi TaxID=2972472 RepID=A0A9X2PER3_9HYPH|nr:NADPH:quinone oxidoreductase family protein [Ancylobacter mangrovi]MCS0496570.1 NADPH:quinone oxidoreductase family protein [Ancylobacter mangrovi]
MKAVRVREFGDVDTPAIEEVAAPTAGPGEVLVRIRATAVNFVDILVIGGKYQFLPPRPFTPGKGPAGEVITLGEGVSDLRVGDRVLAMAEQDGYGEMVAVRQEQCYRLPEAMTFLEAASMSLVYDTAWFALRERGRIKPGDVVFVMGAAGGVGFAAVQLAKAMGARVIAGISGPGREGALAQVGVDGIVDLSMPDLRNSLRARIHELTEGRGADIILDPLGGDCFDAAVRALAWCGRLVVIGFAAGRIPEIRVNYILLKNIEITGLQISDYRKRRPELVAECFAEVFHFYETGQVRPQPATTFTLDRFAEALASIRDRTAKGRLVLLQD